jgi:ribonuclease T2
LSDIEAALSKLHSGSQAYVGCENGSLNQVWYFFNVRGNAIDGQYEATAPRKYSLYHYMQTWLTII